MYKISDGVLGGTVRKLVIAMCEKHGIRIILEAPRVDTIPEWSGAFVTSTSRLVLPIDELVFDGEDGSSMMVQYSEDSIVCRIRCLVFQEMERASEQLFKD